MSLLSESSRQQLQEALEKGISDPVKLIFFTKKDHPIVMPGRECVTCEATGELLRELSVLSDKISLDIHDFYEDSDQAAELKIYRRPSTGQSEILWNSIRTRVSCFHRGLVRRF